MYGLEYALCFGVPENKVELIDGTSFWTFPFASREAAEEHFNLWIETWCRWKQVEIPPVRKTRKKWLAKAAGARMTLFPRPIELRLPIAWEAFDAFLHTFNRRDFWPGQPAGFETGWDSIYDDSDIRMNLWRLFRGLTDRHGGKHSGRVDIAISDTAAVAPDAYCYRKGRHDIMIVGDYFCAAPDLIVEVLSAPTRALDRGPRLEVYRRARVPHVWHVEPLFETVDVYQLHTKYELHGRFGPGESFITELFPGERIAVDGLFDTQAKSWPDSFRDKEEPEPIPEWILPPDMPVGLEYFFGLGHPDRRWEIIGNKCRSVLAFGSAKEARHRMEHFVTEACRWEALPEPKAASMSPEVEQAEIGRFQLTRQGRLVHCDVAVDARRYRELLTTWSKRDAWDWGQ